MARRQFTDLAQVNEAALTVLEYQPSSAPTLSNSLAGLQANIEQAAQQNVTAAMSQAGGVFSETEIQAMVTVESLKLTGGLELAAVLLRAKYLRQIQQGNMLANHPGGYGSLREMAEDNGISVAELSQTLDMVNIVFPYIQSTLGIPVPELWEKIGKSKMRELVPVLKVIITGEASDTRTTQAGAEAILNDAAATLAAIPDGQEFAVLGELNSAGNEQQRRQIMRQRGLTDEDVEALQQQHTIRVREMAVGRLVQDGELLNVRRLRNTLRPEHTDNIAATVIPMGAGRRLVTAIMDDDQFLLLQRKVGPYLDTQVVQLPDDPRQREIEAARINELRALRSLLEG